MYNNAECFVYPSEYEGFGIPILEAFSCKCPVILSNSSCFPEVAGAAAKYFNLGNVNELTNILEEVLYSDSVKQQMVDKGLIRFKDFSWQKCAEETLCAYKKIL